MTLTVGGVRRTKGNTMNTESPRLRALLAAGAAIVAFGIAIPAMADAGGVPGAPPEGSVGEAGTKATPKGQGEIANPNSDSNRGFRCDGNGGAGDGNPALGDCDGATGTGDGGAGGGWHSDT